MYLLCFLCFTRFSVKIIFYSGLMCAASNLAANSYSVKTFFAVLLLLVRTQLQAQGSIHTFSQVYTGLVAYSIKNPDIFSFAVNPASLAQLKEAAAGVSATRGYLSAPLTEYTAVAGMNTGTGNFGCIMNYTGDAAYNRSALGIAYGRKLGARADIGLQFSYHHLRISSGYGAGGQLQAETGLVLHITSQFHAGVGISIPAGGNQALDKSVQMPSVFSTGLVYEPSEKFLCSARIEKTTNNPVDVIAGIQYRPVSALRVRLGVSAATASAWLGAGIQYSQIQLDVFSLYHPQLGITPGIALIFKLNKNRK
jgi:hypothetical protein